MLARQLEEEEYYDSLPQQQQQVIRRRVVVQKTNISKGMRNKAMFLFLLCIGLWGLILFRSSSIAADTYEIGKIRSEARVLERENEQLKVENAKLKAHTRVKEIAEKKLGMTVPKVTYFASDKAKQ